MNIRIPSYRYHKARDCAVVTINGRDHYLGAYRSPESLEAYHRLIAESLAMPHASPGPALPGEAPLTVTELIAAYWKFARTYYIKAGEPTSEQDTIRQALRFLRRLYGATPAREFTPKRLKAVQQAMIDHRIIRRVTVTDPATGAVRAEERVTDRGLARRYINKQVSRIKRMFAWAVAEELVPVEVHAALQRVGALKKGKTAAREKARIRPIDPAQVEWVLPLVPDAIRAMILVQRLCGCRPHEIVEMRGADIATSGAVWEYRPRRHKTEHHDHADEPDRERIVYLGPRAQAILTPILEIAGQGYLFSPIRSEEARNARRRLGRRSAMTPSQASRKPRGRTRAPLREHYDAASYRRAIRRACLRAGIPVWHPNQLRHSSLTEIRKEYGLEASRVCGGHREIGVTQHYAEQDRDLARRVMLQAG